MEPWSIDKRAEAKAKGWREVCGHHLQEERMRFCGETSLHGVGQEAPKSTGGQCDNRMIWWSLDGYALFVSILCSVQTLVLWKLPQAKLVWFCQFSWVLLCGFLMIGWTLERDGNRSLAHPVTVDHVRFRLRHIIESKPFDLTIQVHSHYQEGIYQFWGHAIFGQTHNTVCGSCPVISVLDCHYHFFLHCIIWHGMRTYLRISHIFCSTVRCHISDNLT